MKMKKKLNYNNSTKTAIGGIIAALSLVIMMLTTVIPTLTYAMPAMAGVLLILIVIEVDKKWATGVYVVVSILSMFLIADKEAAVMYVMFFGYYSILKAIIEGKLNKVFSWIVKFAVFNVTMILAFLIVTYVFNIPFDDMSKFGKWSVWILLLIGNFVFLIYDFLLTRLVSLYMLRLHKSFKRIFKY